MAFDYDVLVIGSGFGGSVTALRLTEKGYRVGVLEAGRRWSADSFPKTNWNLRNFLYFPKLGCTGIQRLTLLKDIFVVSGAGVGGGSLVYANTLYDPLEAYWQDPQWAHITDWKSELGPYYDQAKRMLGVNETPFLTSADEVMIHVAKRMGVEDTFHPTPVGVFFGEPGKRVPDPYFGGEGPDKVGCIRCGGCMVGCRHGSKNTLDTNYLYLAEKNGCEVHAETKATDVKPLPDGGYEVATVHPSSWRNTPKRTFLAEQVVFSAATLGTQSLLFKLRDEGQLPSISKRLGALTRTNSEAILGVQARTADRDFSEGIAITSSIHPDEHTHIEPVRYPKGSNAMGMLSTVMVDGGGKIPRPLRFLLTILIHPLLFLRSLSVYRWSEKSIILLVMQTLDNSLQTFRKKGLFGWQLSTKPGHGESNPTWIPIGHEAARHAADIVDGAAGGSIFEALMNVPTTAHIIGGCSIGDSAETGVIDPFHRLYGHEGLHVVDGSSITANLGVNPSLSITALAERAMSFWPNKGEVDERPPLGEPYRRIQPIAPKNAAVPEHAPGALRLPIAS